MENTKPKLYRASELKVGDVVRDNGTSIYHVWKQSDIDIEKEFPADGARWEKQDETLTPPTSPTMTINQAAMSGHELEDFLVQALTNIFEAALQLPPQDKYDLSDFEYLILPPQHFIMPS